MRGKNLRIFGLKENPQENLKDEVISLFAEKLQVNLKNEDIEDSFRTGQRENDKNRQILVKFTNGTVRNEVYRRKKQLKGTRITIREDLTRARRELLKLAIGEFQKENVWTQSGIIYVFFNNKKHKIFNVNDMNAL